MYAMSCLQVLTRRFHGPCLIVGARGLTTTQVLNDNYSCRLLVVGGGSGGCATAAKFSRCLGKKQVIIVDPAEDHYYQPMFTLIGGGIKKLQDARRPMSTVLPKNALWLKDEVIAFEPASNSVRTKKGDHIKYDFMVVAIGIKLLYDAVPGLLEGLKMPNSGVCSNYSHLYVNKTHEALKTIHEGNAVFTFPNTPVKCAGAPQKILYIADDYLRKKKKRNDINLIYNTSLPVIFGVKKYADALWKLVEERNIKVNLRTNLIEVRPDKKEAVFQNLDKPELKTTQEYSMLHVSPPQGAPDVLKTNKDLSDATGFLEIDKNTLQHTKFPNVFGIGDCTSLPTSKTAAAVAAQCGVLRQSLSAVLDGRDVPDVKYDGYTSCPLVTGYGRCILAEFDYNLQPLETFPVNQGVERYTMYAMKAHAMPQIYWHMFLNGYWEGPRTFARCCIWVGADDVASLLCWSVTNCPACSPARLIIQLPLI